MTTPAEKNRFRTLPEPVRPEDMVETVDVSSLPGRDEEAAACLTDALRLFERKGNSVSAERARARLAGASVTASEDPGGRAS